MSGENPSPPEEQPRKKRRYRRTRAEALESGRSALEAADQEMSEFRAEIRRQRREEIRKSEHDEETLSDLDHALAVESGGTIGEGHERSHYHRSRRSRRQETTAQSTPAAAESVTTASDSQTGTENLAAKSAAKNQQDSTSEGDKNTPEEDEKKQKKRPLWLIGIYSFLTMLLILALAGGGFLLYLNSVLNNDITYEALLPNEHGATKKAGDNSQNILLVGSDTWNEDTDRGRSDVLQLVHVSGDRKTISIVHFPRDLYVPIPGHGKNKINASYAYGGIPLLVQTIEAYTGIHIDHVAKVGVYGFKEITDAVGGVEIYVDQAFSEKGYGSWTVGRHHMNGEQALGYVRQRHQLQRGDLDRGVNQQKWLIAIMRKIRADKSFLNPVTLTKMISGLARHTTLDKGMSTTYMGKLAWSLRSINENNMKFYQIPIGAYRTIPGAGAVVIAEEDGLETLTAGIREDNMASVPGGKSAGYTNQS